MNYQQTQFYVHATACVSCHSFLISRGFDNSLCVTGRHIFTVALFSLDDNKAQAWTDRLTDDFLMWQMSEDMKCADAIDNLIEMTADLAVQTAAAADLCHPLGNQPFQRALAHLTVVQNALHQAATHYPRPSQVQ